MRINEPPKTQMNPLIRRGGSNYKGIIEDICFGTLIYKVQSAVTDTWSPPLVANYIYFCLRRFLSQTLSFIYSDANLETPKSIAT